MIWDFQNLLTRRLFLWAALSIVVGTGMILLGDPFWRYFGIQALAWGIIDAIIAWFGLRRVKTRLGKPATLQEEEQEASKVQRLLWINTALDVIYAAGGAAIIYFWGSESLFWTGTGWGIIVQAAFLYFFDLMHALRVPEPLQLPHLPLFTHPDHEPFVFKGGKPAAVLVHGFPGTALEMRHLGRALNKTGWTVGGIRLPGFGSDFANVVHFNNQAWVDAIWEECQSLRFNGHMPIILIGFSFGGALAMQVAANDAVDGLVLIAPITWREPTWARVLIDFMRTLFPLSIHPFRYVPKGLAIFTEQFSHYLPEIDMDNPDHVNELKHLQIPLYVLDQLREVAKEGRASAPDVNIPILLIQGLQDVIIQTKWTDSLREELGGPVTYEKVDGPHHLTMPHNPAYEDVAAKIIAFATQMFESKPTELN
jgi:esterase/lipase